jgi:hypothetical protein
MEVHYQNLYYKCGLPIHKFHCHKKTIKVCHYAHCVIRKISLMNRMGKGKVIGQWHPLELKLVWLEPLINN